MLFGIYAVNLGELLKSPTIQPTMNCKCQVRLRATIRMAHSPDRAKERGQPDSIDDPQ